MGQRMDDISLTYGDNCIPCWPVGETPKYVYARFSLMIPGAPDNVPPCLIPPNDRVFKLTQDPGSACKYEHTSTDWYLLWLARSVVPGGSVLELYDTTGWSYFSQTDDNCPDEGFVYHNAQIFPGGQECALEGIAIITWTPQATALLAAMNMEKAYDLFMELRPLDDGKLVYKFCRLQDATNIKFLLEP